MCQDGIRWFIEKERWYRSSITPKKGMIVFFDWDGDGNADHTGIVSHCQDGLVYTIEGNSVNQCKEQWYIVGDACILGYGG